MPAIVSRTPPPSPKPQYAALPCRPNATRPYSAAKARRPHSRAWPAPTESAWSSEWLLLLWYCFSSPMENFQSSSFAL